MSQKLAIVLLTVTTLLPLTRMLGSPQQPAIKTEVRKAIAPALVQQPCVAGSQTSCAP